tara:strand:- start:359 stop:463 length:105 start_codon:yes stop_codon:yes gene_type:complete
MKKAKLGKAKPNLITHKKYITNLIRYFKTLPVYF